MSDLALKYIDGVIDLDFGDDGAVIDDGLRTAVIISLFCDRRADDSDILPDGGSDRRGWWGDVYPDVDGDRIGSRLWMNDREKQMASVLRRDETYAKEALAWMIDDGVASAVSVVAENKAPGVRAIRVSITRPNGDVVDFKFDGYWEAEYAL